MASQPLPSVLDYLRRLAPPGEDEASDAELLERFVRRRGAEAFALLLRRHGPMVYGVCRRLLGDGPDAEDAFQAVFLILARRATTIGRGAALAGWLYKVARRTALEARRRRARRNALPLDEGAAASGGVDPAAEAAWREIGRLLEDEVGRLPEIYRVPFILFHFEGRANRAIAVELRCPLGTVEARLSRARERLRRGLSRRGVSLPSALLAAALSHGLASAQVPPALLVSTVVAIPTGAFPAGVVALAEGMVRAMNATRLKLALAVLLLAGLVGAGVAAVYRVPAAGEKKERPAPKADRPRDDAAARELEKLQGTWVMAAVEWDGDKPAEQDVTTDARRELVIRGNSYVEGQVKGKKGKGFLRVDPRKSPRTMDRSDTEAFKAGETTYELYELDGDVLKTCYTVKDGKMGPRPTEFKTAADRVQDRAQVGRLHHHLEARRPRRAGGATTGGRHRDRAPGGPRALRL